VEAIVDTSVIGETPQGIRRVALSSGERALFHPYFVKGVHQ
jgi:hypothetical protein